MNPDVINKWTEALRSGEYEQTFGLLKDEADGYCCLGVLCDISPYKSDTFWGANFPDKRVLDWAGITFDLAKELAGINDGAETFPKIADYIERCANQEATRHHYEAAE